MAIEDVSLYEDILNISQGKEYGTRKVFECYLIIDQIQIKAMSINSYVFERDYRYNYSDNTIIEVMVPMGTYTTSIYPNRMKLMAQIKTSVTDSKGTSMDNDGSVTIQTFRATILDSKNPAMIDSMEESENAHLGDISTLVPLSLQLTDPILEAVRQTNLQTILKNVTLENVIKCLLRGDFIVNDNLPKADGVNVVEPDNRDEYRQIIIPPTLNSIEITDWLQNRYGIYNNGLGVYLQRKKWYVYPTLQTDKFKADDRSVTIVSLPPAKLSGSEKTFDFIDKHLVILATGGTDQTDNSDSMQRNIGNGIRYINASKVIDEYCKTTNGTTYIDSDKNIIEFKSSNKADGLNYIPFYKKIATVNHAKILSEIAINRTNTIVLDWENSFPDLLYPGMKVKYLYRENNQVKTITGTLSSVIQRYLSCDQGILQNVHSSLTQMTILVEAEAEM